MKKNTATRTIYVALALFALSATSFFPAPLAAQQAANAEAEVARLKKKVERLERQLSDLQILVGTLESLARKGGMRLPSPSNAAPSAPAPGYNREYDRGYGVTPSYPPRQGGVPGGQYGGSGGYAAPAPLGTGFGAQVNRAEPSREEVRREGTITPYAQPLPLPQQGAPRPIPAPTPEITEFESDASELPPLVDGLTDPPVRVAAKPAPTGPKALYTEAYGLFQNDNYTGAEKRFREFLQKHPKDTLAGKAQYWLGESLFLRGEYREAAISFLKGYDEHKKGEKAPDSLLRLAMSLRALKEKAAACSMLLKLKTEFPKAPKHLKRRADSEHRKAGC